MREIKYRVWNEELKEMYTVSKEKYLGSTGIVDPYVGHEKAVWMQYTGLTDVNNREIYEGDIIKAPTDFGPAGFEEKLHEVKYDLVQGYGWNYVLIDRIEVIGNIYQHKHLLKENEKC